MISLSSIQIIPCRCRSSGHKLVTCLAINCRYAFLYSFTTLKFEPALLQSLVVPIGIFSSDQIYMLSTTRTNKESSENCQKLARLGNSENSFNSLNERLLGIYYDGRKNNNKQQQGIEEQAQESQTIQT